MVASGLSFAKDRSSETQFEIAPDEGVHQIADWRLHQDELIV